MSVDTQGVEEGPVGRDRSGERGGDELPGTARARLLIVLAILYSGQAIPAYLIGTAAVPIMREQGVPKSAIGLVGLLLIPLLLRFLWAPAIDRIRPFARAHRAGWIGLTQTAIIALLVALSFVRPSSIGPFMTIGLAISLLLATNDIAVDGYATRMLSPADRPVGNAIQGAGVSAGVIVGGSGGMIAYQFWGWQVAVLIVATLSLLPFLAVAMMREADAEIASPREARPSLRAFFARPEAVTVLGVALVYRASEGLMNAMVSPYLVDEGVALDTIGYLTGAAAATAGIAGSLAAAFLMMRLGAIATLGLLGILRTACYLWFALHAAGMVSGNAGLFAAAGFETLLRAMETVAMFTLFMIVSSKAQPGTDYSLLSCAQILIYLIGWASAGVIADRLGYGPLFGVATAVSLFSVMISIRLLKGKL